MEQQFLNEILKDTFTLDVFKKRVMALKLVLEEKLYGSKGADSAEKDGSLAKKAILQKQQAWVGSFTPEVLAKINSDNFKGVFDYIDTFTGSAMTLSIYFVFIPEDDQVREVGEWLRKNLNNPALVYDIKVDPSLIGGCAIAYKGVYKDYSLKARIEANKQRLMEEFRAYLKQ